MHSELLTERCYRAEICTICSICLAFLTLLQAPVDIHAKRSTHHFASWLQLLQPLGSQLDGGRCLQELSLSDDVGVLDVNPASCRGKEVQCIPGYDLIDYKL